VVEEMREAEQINFQEVMQMSIDNQINFVLIKQMAVADQLNFAMFVKILVDLIRGMIQFSEMMA